MAKKKKSNPWKWVGILAIICVVASGFATRWWGLAGTPTPSVPTTMTISPKNRYTSEALNASVLLVGKDTTGVQSSTYELWNRDSLADVDSYVIDTDVNTSVSFTYTSGYIYWARITITSAGTWRVQWVALSPGDNDVLFTNESCTFAAMAYNDLLGTTLAGTTRASWTVIMGCYDAEHNLTSTEGFGIYWNATDPTATVANQGEMNYGMVFQFNFDNIPLESDVSVENVEDNAIQVQGNSVNVFLQHSVTSKEYIQITFGSRVVSGTIAVQSLNIGIGSIGGLIDAAPLATLV